MNRKYDEVKCIWADSGTIGYKLCDKNFDCENCELDKALRKNAILNTEMEENNKTSKNIIGKISSEINSVNYDRHYIYLKNYLCLKNLFEDKYFLGISPMLYNLFLNTNVSFNCVKQYSVSVGDKAAEISGEWGSIDIASPIVMKVLKQIPQTIDDVNSTNWIGIVEIDNTDFDSVNSYKYNENKNFITSLLRSTQIENFVTMNTMYDGGKKVKNLPELLGGKEFVDFIKKILST